MNAISKRLLSWLCVIAMVLSLAPVMNLTAAAVETQAADEIVYGSANYEGVDAAIIEQMNAGNAIDNSDEAFATHLANNTCPVCGEIDGWEKLSNAADKAYVASHYYGKEEHTGMKLHWYYDDSVTKAAGNMIGFAEKATGNSACIWIKSTQNITNDSTRAVMLASTNVVNIFGEGSLTTTAAGKLNMFQIGNNAVLNLYGGNFVYEHPQTNFQLAAIRMDGKGTVNIFDGVKVGPAELDDTKVAVNVLYKGAGTVNMFGGEIRNGVSPAWGYSGNVSIAAQGTFNMYGGTITGGTFLSATTSKVTNNATLGGNVMVGGKNQEAYYKEDGTDDYTTTSGTFNMYGGTISDGKVNNGGNGGGNINVYNGGAVANIQGGTIENGTAKSKGGNIQVSGGTLNLSGTALVIGGTAGSHGGNIVADSTNSILNISGGKIADGTTTGASTNGGNVYIDALKSATISGGVISGGKTNAIGGHGGNLYIGAKAEGKLTITGGTFEDGIAGNQGGNISVGCDLEIANATVIGGIGRKGGGNISTTTQQKTLTLTDCTVANGWVSGASDAEGNLTAPGGANWGGNVRVWVGNLVIDGGLYYGGMRGVDQKNKRQDNNVAALASVDSTGTASVAGASLTIKGDAIIVGDVSGSAPSANKTGEFTCPGTTVKLEGAPQIVNRYQLADGQNVSAGYGALTVVVNSYAEQKIDISGLTSDAYVMFTTANDSDGKTAAETGRVVSLAADNAAELLKAGCFGQTNKKWMMAVNEANELYVTELHYEFEAPVKPEATLGGQNVSDEVWAEVVKAAEIQVNAKNLDPAKDTTCPACGATDVEWIEATKPGDHKTAETVSHYYIKADTQVTATYNWAALQAADQTMCILLKNGSTVKEIGGLIGARNSATGGTINIMGEGIITSNGTKTNDAQFGTICLQGNGNTLNLYGGTFIYTGDGQGRAKDDEGKYQPNGTIEAAAINLKGHTNTINMFDGVIVGPEKQDLTKPCYNVRIEVQTAKMGNTFNMYGGEIRNGVTNVGNTSGNLHIHYDSKKTSTLPTFNMYGGSIVNGNHVESATSTAGGNIYARAGAQMNIYGGTIADGTAKTGGNIYIDTSSVSKVLIAGGTISGGNAAQNGGNLFIKAATEISGYALIENGTAATSGGNVYVAEGKTVTQKAGTEIRNGTANGVSGAGGGNVFVNTSTYIMEGGKIYDGKALNSGANAGNVLVQGSGKVDKEAQTTTFTDAIFNMSGDAEIYGGEAGNQAGNIRAYIGTVTMTDNAKVYGGVANSSSSDNVWLVDGNLTMDGKAAVHGTEEGSGSAIQAAVYRRGSNITLKGEASVIPENGTTYGLINYGEGTHADFKTPLQCKLYVDNSWTGTAYINPPVAAPGTAIDEMYAVCGTEVDGVFTKGGSFEGKLYLSKLANCPAVGVDGLLTLSKNGVAKADGTGAWFETAAEALENYKFGEDLYVILSEDATISSDVVIELAGQNITLSGKGKIYGMDFYNDSFEEFGVITIAEGAEIEYAAVQYNPMNNRRYAAVLNGNELSFHYITISITDVSLRTEGAGIYYKSKFKCDETLAAAIDSYGVILSLDDMPGADFQTEEGLNLATEYAGPITLDEKGEFTATSGAVTGIMKAARTAEENQAIAEMKIYSNAYVKVGDNYVLFKGENPYAEPDPEKDVIAYSLKDVMVAIDDNWASYADEQKTLVNEFYTTWADLGMSAWASELENVVAYEPPAAEAPEVTG